MKELNDYFQNPWEVDKGGWRASGEREREDGRLKNKVAFTNKLHNTNMEEKRDFTR
jgi:hypothetical protein